MLRCKIELLVESEIRSITDNRRAVARAVALTKLIKRQTYVNVSPRGINYFSWRVNGRYFVKITHGKYPRYIEFVSAASITRIRRLTLVRKTFHHGWVCHHRTLVFLQNIFFHIQLDGCSNKFSFHPSVFLAPTTSG